jgi:hypothetical protein
VRPAKVALEVLIICCPITDLYDINKREKKIKYIGLIMKGGSLGQTASKLFLQQSYKKNPKPVGKFQVDKQLSTKRSAVYVNPSGKVVISHQDSKGAKDWLINNPAILLGQYKNTKRYKDIEDAQKKKVVPVVFTSSDKE